MMMMMTEHCAVVCRFIELDEGETAESVTQHDIVQAVDVTSAQKVYLNNILRPVSRFFACATACSAKRVLAIVISVCPSVCHVLLPNQAQMR